jgi:hypothetical protein
VLREHGWRKVRSVPKPPDRGAGAAVWDSARRELVMFGGFGEDHLLDDTWTLRKH